MNTISIKISDTVIKFISPYRIASGFFKSFFTEQSDDVTIVLDETDEKVLYEMIDEQTGTIGWEGTLGIDRILRRLSTELIDRGLILLHGAAISVNGLGYVFAGMSGVGKTTHMLKWLSHFPDAYVVNGDKPFIQFSYEGSKPLACGSPWAGKENYCSNTTVPITAIVLMERAEENHIEQISFLQAFPFLLQQVYRPDDEEKMRKTLRLMQQLNGSVSFWRFKCNNFKDDCFDVAYSALVRDQK